MSGLQDIRDFLGVDCVEVESFDEHVRRIETQWAMDMLTPGFWCGRRIHGFHSRPRIVAWDEVGDAP